jgi:polar amino acid transport system permease protein
VPELSVVLNPDYRALLLTGVRTTVSLFVGAWLLGMVLGAVLAAIRSLPLSPLRWAVVAYVGYHRNVPALIQLFVWYFGIAALLPDEINDPINDYGAEFVFALLALSCNSAAYISEDLRSGFRAVLPGQMEAAQAIGLHRFAAMRLVILPQAWRHALPALVGQTVSLFKLTSLAAAIGVAELTYEARHIENLTFRIFETFGAATLLYVIGTLSLMGMGSFVAHRTRIRMR